VFERTQVLIIGGGISGLTTAETLADFGIPSFIVERDPDLGGNAAKWACTATDECSRCSCCLVGDRVKSVRDSELAHIFTGWEVTSIRRDSSDLFQVSLLNEGTGEGLTVETAVIVSAVGFRPYDPTRKVLLGYGRLDGVLTLPEINTFLRNDDLDRFTGRIKDVSTAFFQCIGSRDEIEGANYCSGHCCTSSLRTALKLKHEVPGSSITLFYIDLQVAGKYGKELLSRAGAEGVRLYQGVPGEITQTDEGKLQVWFEHDGRNVCEYFDRVILSVGQRPPDSIPEDLIQMGLLLDEFGYIELQEPKADGRTSLSRVYSVGACNSPKNIQDSIRHAKTAVLSILEDFYNGSVRQV
jgi:heterodisulfide reductase subunit A2